MPAEQRGSAYKTRKGWGVRWLDGGRRHHKSGFPSKTAALSYFRDEVRPRLLAASTIDPAITLKEFVELYLAAHALKVEASTLTTLRSVLRTATRKFGDVELRKLERQAADIAAWRATIATGSRRSTTQALRQCLAMAVSWGVIQRNPAKLAGENPQPKRSEIVPFTKDEIDRICGELGPQGKAMVRFAAATGLRPCELFALEWRDFKRDENILLVERTFARYTLRAYGKTDRSRRRVPLSKAALNALASFPRRLDTPLIFPAVGGERIHLNTWTSRDWRPAMEAAGIDHGTFYTLRHCFATNAIAAGIGLFDLSRYMGTSLKMLDLTYGHLVPGAEDAARAKLDAAGGFGV